MMIEQHIFQRHRLQKVNNLTYLPKYIQVTMCLRWQFYQTSHLARDWYSPYRTFIILESPGTNVKLSNVQVEKKKKNIYKHRHIPFEVQLSNMLIRQSILATINALNRLVLNSVLLLLLSVTSNQCRLVIEYTVMSQAHTIK